LTEAQAQASGPELLRLTAQRRELESALMRRARTLADQAGVSVSAPMEREAQETLAAAVALPEVADEVRTGRLVKPAAYAGFGAGFGTLVPAGAPQRRRPAGDEAEDSQAKPDRAPRTDELAARRAAAAPKPGQDDTDAERTSPDQHAQVADFEARTAQRGRERRAEGERRVAEARAALDVAAEALAEQRRAADAAARRQQELQEQHHQGRQRLTELQQQVEELRQRVRELQAEIATAEQSALGAMRRRDQAEKAHEAAGRALQQAEQNLADTT
jgi:hypothetical protein